MVNFSDWIIENGINQIACFLEIWMILLCVHGIFKQRFKVTLENIILISVDLVVMALIYMKILGELASVFVYLMIFVYCVMKFKTKFGEAIGRFLLSFFVIVLIEIFASIVATPIAHAFQVDEALMLLINTLGLVMTMSIFKIPWFRMKKIHLNMDKGTWRTLILLCGFSALFIIVDYRIRGKVDQIYYFIFLISCVMVCFSAISAQRTKHMLEKRKLELEMQEI